MLAWNDLPVASKKEVIKRLDLMSRTAMRCTSRAHREIVDATEFYVPRVRFSSKKSDCMIMIYTDIEKFLRIEIDTLDQGVMVYRMENTYNRAEATKRAIPTIGSYTLAYKILQSLFVHDSVLLGALEIEFPLGSISEAEKMMVACMHRALGGGRFRTKKLVTTRHTADGTELMLYKNMCVVEELEELRNEGLWLNAEQLECRKVLDITILPEKSKLKNFKRGDDIPVAKFIHVPSYETNLWLAQMRQHQPLILTEKAKKTTGFATVRFGLFPGELDLWEHQGFPIEKLNEHILMKRYVSPAKLTLRWNKSECGTWVHMVKSDQEHKYLDFFKNEKCGLRWLCKKCTDPFEQWFYKELPRRIYHEPEWNHIALGHHDDAPLWMIEELVRKMREQYAEDEKKRAKNKTSAESWGFKKSNAPKTAPVEFVCGEDFDDMEGLMNDGKELHVKMDEFEIVTSEWVSVKKKRPSFSNKSFMSDMKSMTMEDFCESMGVKMRMIQDGGLPRNRRGKVNKVDVEALRKKIDSMPPSPEIVRELMDSGKDEKEEEVDGESVKELNRAEKKAERNRKKKEKKKIRKQQQANSEQEEGCQMD